MPVGLLIAIAVAVVLVVCLLVAADRAVKVIKRGLRRREAGERLAAAAAQAEAEASQRKAAEQASGALTSVMPTIHDVETRRVQEPGTGTMEHRAGPVRLDGPPDRLT